MSERKKKKKKKKKRTVGERREKHGISTQSCRDI